MLKACWDCIADASANRGQVGGEEVYGTQLNGNMSSAREWWPVPQLQNEKIFMLPKIIQTEDNISISGETHSTDSRQLLVLSLLTEKNGRPDYNNITFQIHCDFSGKRLTIRSVINGAIENENEIGTTEDFMRDHTFSFRFKFTGDRSIQTLITKGDMYFADYNTNFDHAHVKYLSVHGDVMNVQQLEFVFA